MFAYPINLDIENKLCLIVGGGDVASRKIDSLLLSKARVRIISPHSCSKVTRLSEQGSVEWLQRNYKQGDVEGVFLVIAATNKKTVQEQIIKEANERNILLNVVDNPLACSFQVPATVRRGSFLLAISTGGGSPGLAAKIRKKIELEYGPEYGLYVALLAKIRETIVGDGGTQESHKRVLEKLLQLNILTHIRKGNWRTVQNELTMVLQQSVDVPNLVASLLKAEKQESITRNDCVDNDI